MSESLVVDSAMLHRASRAKRRGDWTSLAVDFDGTLTTDGRPPAAEVLGSLRAVKRTGRKLLLVTGRCTPEIYQRVDGNLFDGIVAENGAVLVVGRSVERSEPEGWHEVRRRVMSVVGPGCEEVIVSAERNKFDLVNPLVGESAKIVLNKDRLMVSPIGVDKGIGLVKALAKLGLHSSGTICIGDGENDLPMFDVVGMRVALANSVEELKRRADYVASFGDGEGTMEAIQSLLLGGEEFTQ